MSTRLEDQRRHLLDVLERYLRRFPEDRERAEPIRRFVRTHEACFERSCREGHVTGSAWVVSEDREHVLLHYHRKLQAWLQLGGHADGEGDAAAVALREAREESGLESLTLVDWSGDGVPLDVDVHLIPAREDVPAHRHHDLRYLVTAERSEPLRPSRESEELRWVPYGRLEHFSAEGSLLRMARKARRVLPA